jgi:DNA-binding NarL/FixJ family response regulator
LIALADPGTTHMTVQILLAEDHNIVREGLRALLATEAEFEVIGEASDGRTAVARVAELSPDVIVMDLHMPDLNGIEATRRVLAEKPNVKIIGLSANSDPNLILEMLKAGASGYVVKDSAFQELSEAIRTVMQNKVYLSPAVQNVLVDDYVRGAEGRSTAFSTLSSREREVLQLTAEGKATKEVARMLSVSVKTVETHRRNIMMKLNIDNVAQLTKYAIREGLSSL